MCRELERSIGEAKHLENLLCPFQLPLVFELWQQLPLVLEANADWSLVMQFISDVKKLGLEGAADTLVQECQTW